jgi:hypothetical protein
MLLGASAFPSGVSSATPLPSGARSQSAKAPGTTLLVNRRLKHLGLSKPDFAGLPGDILV